MSRLGWEILASAGGAGLSFLFIKRSGTTRIKQMILVVFAGFLCLLPVEILGALAAVYQSERRRPLEGGLALLLFMVLGSFLAARISCLTGSLLLISASREAKTAVGRAALLIAALAVAAVVVVVTKHQAEMRQLQPFIPLGL